MNKYSINLLSYLVYLLPLTLIIGQAAVSINVFLISVIYLIFIINRKVKLDYNFLIILFIIFYITALFSATVSDYKFYSFQHASLFIRFFLLSLAIYFILSQLNHASKKLLYIFFFISLAVITIAILQYIFNLTIFSEKFIMGQSTRLSGIFGKENILGSYLFRIYPILLSLFFINYKKNNNILTFFLILIFFFNFFIIIISGERTSLIVFILTNLMIIFFLKKNYIFKFNIFLIIFIFPFLILSLNPKIKYRVVDYTFEQISFNPPYIIDDVYIDLFSTSLEIFNDNKIFGSGPNTFRKKCAEVKYIKKHSCSTSPHNFYLQVLTETGIIGFAIISLFYFYFITNLLKTIFKKNANQNTLNAYILINISILINFFPLMQTGSFFSNWLMTISCLPFGLYFYYKVLLTNNINEI